MPVIVASTPKGGVGKTTTCLLLATELAHRGINIVLIDADANEHIKRWKDLSTNVPDNIKVVVDRQDSTIMSTIKKYDQDGTIVIVDLQGGRSLVNSRAMAKADLVMLVTRPMVLDTDTVATAREVIELEEEALNRPIPRSFVITQTSHVASKEERQVVKFLTEQSGEDVVTPYLSRRVHYSALHARGNSLREMPAHSSLANAIAEAGRFADAIYNRLLDVLHVEEAA
ncbi:ParA family protein [Sulfitobacter sp. R18_1]|uniref:ParA family protein n=1 Tax=Sulfitobacter sp. R18_1 TaxID=2821104 RepID=UPI001ADAB2AF|nr:ParA family protein [Sulfitobacter sp. R18_1]MBO9428422.1 ParA family protein [Sulfitobacter sp. R18_1]